MPCNRRVVDSRVLNAQCPQLAAALTSQAGGNPAKSSVEIEV